MITNANPNMEKSANDYLENIRQKIGVGHSDRAETRSAKKELGKDDFIKLMSTQLKYQDPTSPLKNEEMAAQLAQFSSVEQMSNVNRNLEKMSNSSASRDNLMAASLIGKRIQTNAAQFKLTEDRNVTMNFDLPSAVVKGTVSVVDAKGAVVREIPIDKMEKGKQNLKWDGRDAKGTNSPVGEYSFRVTAYDSGNKPVEAKTSSSGLISGVEFENGKPILLVDGERVSMENISKIENGDAKTSSETKQGKEAAKSAVASAAAVAPSMTKERSTINSQVPKTDPENLSGSWLQEGVSEANRPARSPDAVALQDSERPMEISDPVEPSEPAVETNRDDGGIRMREGTRGADMWNPLNGES